MLSVFASSADIMG